MRFAALIVGSVCCLSAGQNLTAQTTDDGVPIVDWSDAAQHYGQEVIVHGKVVLTRNIGFYTFLNFHQDFRNHFTVLIKQESYGNFPEPPEKLYDGKRVAVRGTVIKYRDKPEIIATAPEQITILPDDVANPDETIKQAPPAPVSSDGRPSALPTAKGFAIGTINLAAVLGQGSQICAAGGNSETKVTPEQTIAIQLVHELDADILAVQNVDSLDCLQRFNQQMLSEMNYRYIVGYANPSTGRLDCALLSRHPLSATAAVTQYYTKKRKAVEFHRPPLEAQLEAESGERLKIVVVNLPAPDEKVKSSDRRADARGLTSYLADELTLSTDCKIIVCGGFGVDAASNLISPLIRDLQLSIPGYDPPPGSTAPLPVIAKIPNFVLVSRALKNLYRLGSTRIQHPENLPAAVAVSLDIALPTGRPSAPAPAGGDDF